MLATWRKMTKASGAERGINICSSYRLLQSFLWASWDVTIQDELSCPVTLQGCLHRDISKWGVFFLYDRLLISQHWSIPVSKGFIALYWWLWGFEWNAKTRRRSISRIGLDNKRCEMRNCQVTFCRGHTTDSSARRSQAPIAMKFYLYSS